MARIRKAGFKPTTTLRQVGLSVVTTLIATAIAGGLRTELAGFGQPAPPAPLLTSGGKFAARVDTPADQVGGESPNPFPSSPVPLLAAESAKPVVLTSLPVGRWSEPKPEPAQAKQPRHLVRADSHRKSVTAVALAVPPRRSDYVAPAKVGGDLQAEAGSAPSLWDSTKGIVSDAVWLSDAVWKRVTPANLVP